MIASFADEKTEHVFRRRHTQALPQNVQKRARDKLLILDKACAERDLHVLPGGGLERPGGDRAGQWSLRVDERWCLCFEWQHASARAVQLVARPQ